MPPERVSVYVAEDHPLFLDGLRQAIKLRPDLQFIGSSDDGARGLLEVRELLPAVLVLDLQLPGLDGHGILNAITRDGLPVKVLVLSAYVEGRLVYDTLALGAAGFLSKLTGAQEVCDAIVAVSRGESVIPSELQAGLLAEIRGRKDAERPRLTDRELAVLRLLADGHSAPMIADSLHLSTSTVRTHLQSVYDKLGVSTQAAAVAVGMRQGYLE